MRDFFKWVLAVLGVGFIISGFQTISDKAMDIADSAERTGFIIGCILVMALGAWLAVRPFISKKKNNDDGSK